jgi:hypothetical protein
MPRIKVPTSNLTSRGGVTPTFIPADSGSNHSWDNTGAEKVLVVTGTPGSVTLKFRSSADPHGRFDPENTVVQGASKVTMYGPFTPPSIWGDGSSLGYLDVSSVSGSVSLAVIR